MDELEKVTYEVYDQRALAATKAQRDTLPMFHNGIDEKDAVDYAKQINGIVYKVKKQCLDKVLRLYRETESEMIFNALQT